MALLEDCHPGLWNFMPPSSWCHASPGCRSGMPKLSCVAADLLPIFPMDQPAQGFLLAPSAGWVDVQIWKSSHVLQRTCCRVVNAVERSCMTFLADLTIRTNSLRGASKFTSSWCECLCRTCIRGLHASRVRLRT